MSKYELKEKCELNHCGKKAVVVMGYNLSVCKEHAKKAK